MTHRKSAYARKFADCSHLWQVRSLLARNIYQATRGTQGGFLRQHTKDDLIQYVDFGYLANVARINLLTAGTLADADPAPSDVRLDPKQAHDTILRWQPVAGAKYLVYWRDSATPVWQKSIEVDGGKGEVVISKVNKDDTTFSLGAVGGIPIEAR